MNKVYLGIGSNLGDRKSHMQFAQKALSELESTSLIAFSDVLETEPVGPIAQDKFLNAAAFIETTLKPEKLLYYLQKIEAAAGRLNESDRTKWGPRQLDIDILFFGTEIINTDPLTIPHPLMHERNFVLQPLSQIAADATHPILRKNVKQLLEELLKTSSR